MAAIPVSSSPDPLVSVVVIFLDEQRFLPEAIDSVLAQTYSNWELILVDDGSKDGSSAIARRAAAADPDRIRYLEHEGHENRGKSRSRNLGVDSATGVYVAYLDGDDVWLPEKLERQIALTVDHPEARIVFGPLRRWFSWTGDPEDRHRDDLYGIHGDGLTLEVNRLYEPPELLALFLEHKDLVPSGALFERALFHEVGGAEEAFRDQYEDAVAMVKMCLRANAYCADDSWYLYRQHPDRMWSSTEHSPHRLRYLDWAADYFAYQQVTNPTVTRALRRGRRSTVRPRLHRAERLGTRGLRALRRFSGNRGGRQTSTPEIDAEPEPVDAETTMVSAIIIFKDEERFIEEAVASVFAQTFDDWELILVDDGSTDGSSKLARDVANEHDHVHYLEHPGHENRGMSASRNLGLSVAKGVYISFLDADDVWLANKLECQVADMTAHPEAAMVFGPLLRWRRWTGEPEIENYEHLVGNGWRPRKHHPYAGYLVAPPKLVHLILGDEHFIPSGGLIKRRILDDVGRFENPFRGWFEDAVVMIKICLRYPVLVSPDVLYLYRWHPDSSTQRLEESEIPGKRRTYRAWVEAHLRESGMYTPRMRLAILRGRLVNHVRDDLQPTVLESARSAGRVIIPLTTRDRLRRFWRERTKPPV